MKIRPVRFFPLLLAIALFTGIVFAATTSETPATQAKRKKKKKSTPKTTVTVYSGKTVTTKIVPRVVSKPVASNSFAPKVSRPQVRRGRRPVASQWDEPTYADSTAGDNVDGEDLEVRRAAVEALGPLNGSVVVSDPSTGRILAMVNQKMALSSGAQPCSTI